jgi:hypothetical protein
MKFRSVLIGMAALFGAAHPAVSAGPTAKGLTAQLVVTVRPTAGEDRQENLQVRDLTVSQGNTFLGVDHLQRLTGDAAAMQMFIFLDDSTRSSALGTHLAELRTFLQALPASTQVAIGYMRNGTFALAQEFTLDHQKAAAALRLPEGIPGGNGSPYFALSDLAKRWPSKQPTNRRAVLMFTDGVDRYYEAASIDDPYVDASIREALKDGVMVYSIYLHGAGTFNFGGMETNLAQSRLIEVSQQTGGFAYFEGFSDPVAVTPFLTDFRNRLENQYQVTLGALRERGVRQIKVRSEVPGLKIEGPTRIYPQ